MAQLIKIEFDLTIKKYQDKRDPYTGMNRDEKPKFEVTEELKFKSLSVVEVIRKLLDYMYD